MDPEYWQRVADCGDAPSTLDLIFPECFLDKGPDIPAIHRRMTECRDEVLGRAVEGLYCWSGAQLRAPLGWSRP